jgi:hypothetical protein
LKQLQLIQFLGIKALQPVDAGFVTAKAGRINSAVAHAKRPKAASGVADTAFSIRKMGFRRARRFTAR